MDENLANKFNGKAPLYKSVTKDEFNDLMFETIGLSLSEDEVIIDDDLDLAITFKGKYLVLDEERTNPEDPNCPYILYDVAYNGSLMNHLFNHYLTKYNSENDTDTVSIAHHTNTNIEGMSYAILTQSNGNVVKSRSYYNDSVKYADIIMQLNSDICYYDFSQIDKEIYDKIQKDIYDRKHAKRGRKEIKKEGK